MSRIILPYCGRLKHFSSNKINFIRTIVHTDQPYPGTGLCGLYVNTHPHKDLSEIYVRILRVLDLMPKDYPYRQTTEQIVKERFGHVNSTDDIQILEEKIGMGQIEEVIEQALNELEAARTLVHYKAWEPLVEAPDEYQWRWPIAPGP
ncbi:unnamed protein product [Meloidogyne enterolobii]|uniref:Uncharacterized protein n=1 Tax=Meloidogyne enterolobii TaxID=390850 RepID=A0ACB0YH32_MELEN